MSHHEFVAAQLVRDRAAAFTEEAIARSIVRSRPDRRPPPGRHWIDRRARRFQRARVAH